MLPEASLDVHSDSVALAQIPVIDLAQPDSLAAEQMASACSTLGFFYGKGLL